MLLCQCQMDLLLNSNEIDKFYKMCKKKKKTIYEDSSPLAPLYVR